MGKTVIAPIVAFIFVLIKLTFGIDLGTELEAQIIEWAATGSALVLVLIGIVQSHKKKEKSPE